MSIFKLLKVIKSDIKPESPENTTALQGCNYAPFFQHCGPNSKQQAKKIIWEQVLSENSNLKTICHQMKDIFATNGIAHSPPKKQ